MATPEATTGNLARIFWGFNNLSAIGSTAGGTPKRALIEVPATLEEDHRYQVTGSSILDDFTVKITRQDLNFLLFKALDDKTAYPMLVTTSGTAGNLAFISEGSRIATHPDNQEVDVWTMKELGFAQGEGSIPRIEASLLFDHLMNNLTGVTAVQDGDAVNVGAVSATESVTVIWVNPHSPAPTVAGGVAQLESDDAVGFATPTVQGVPFTALTSTPSFEVQTFAGPITDDWWRISITAWTSGTGFPVGAMFIHDT